MGVDDGEGKGAPFDEKDEENAKAIDPKTQKSLGEDGMEKHNGSKCFFEGDILMSPKEIVGEDRSATTVTRHLWTKYDGIVHVPYILSSSYRDYERANILRAFESYAKHTCIR